MLAWRERVPELGFTFDVSHAALFRNFAAAYPSPFGLVSDAGLDPARFIEELGPATEVAHVSNAAGLLGEGLPYGDGELDLDPLVRRIGELAPLIVAEINEPDQSRSELMKEGCRRIERALRGDARPSPPRRRLPDDAFDWQRVLGRRDPVPALLELEKRLAGRSVLITGGGGSIGGRLASLLAGFRPSRLTLVDSHEASLAAGRRAWAGEPLDVSHVLCDIRDRGRLEAEFERARPDFVYHLAAYKHVDWAEKFPEEFADTNLDGTWNVLEAARASGTETVVVASTDKAATAASVYGRTKRLMEELTALAGQETGMSCVALRLVNALGSAGSASDLFLRQARAGVPLTITDTGMLRYWITIAHAVTMAAHATLLAAEGESLVTAADPAELSVGELATRIWTAARGDGEPEVDLLGVREGETQREVLIAPGESLGEERFPGTAAISGGTGTGLAAWAAERLPACETREEARTVWLEALEQADLFAARG
jgi:nucleoside-diphosphate-sugar epimerase